jgi:hypothetical protein
MFQRTCYKEYGKRRTIGLMFGDLELVHCEVFRI